MPQNLEGKTSVVTKILDTFLFTHEFDLLELRLRALWPVVDKFLLMEGDHNFANKPKEMRFNEQEERFAWAKEKLVVVSHVGAFKDAPENVAHGELFVEHQHRQALYDAAIILGKTERLDKDDILLISDIDEIPSREVIEKLKADKDFPSPLLFNQDFYYYNIRCHRGKRWHGTMAMRFGYKLGDVGAARLNRSYMPKLSEHCGWHFAHFYDSAGIKEKLEHSSHQHYNSSDFYDPDYLKKCVAENKSYLGKNDGDSPPEPIPAYMMEELKKFPIMMGEEWR